MHTHPLGPKHLLLTLLLVVSACGREEPKPEASMPPEADGPMMSVEDEGRTVNAMTCNGTAGEWHGCRGTGCSVCTELVAAFPYYFQNHPSCQPNSICYGQYFQCNAACPPPTEADRNYPAACDGSAGQWNGCRGTGCSVCAELVADYPCYFTNHPNCAENNICYGSYFQCNSKCPAPTQADRCYTTTCGNGICESGETTSCPSDCGTCGDGLCQSGEEFTCPLDCEGTCPGSMCSDGSCCPSTGICPNGRHCPL
ncbi:hypothetical protein JY651_31675 [Pyxidicoccus parkwayensis]|uniref:Lipoprotein n=1 Tax=Pyxidicoccus parkwayensis TaxID=2813578 RepID=A0ABX7NLT4_9BACT|nr:hypothetical protein [Pyxidicoccus parkwaysis]QSQ19830.1 hypothetical protein JY651_31675 [Pyxidicoccus parkwaysis]